jgi:hypothetical protein
LVLISGIGVGQQREPFKLELYLESVVVIVGAALAFAPLHALLAFFCYIHHNFRTTQPTLLLLLLLLPLLPLLSDLQCSMQDHRPERRMARAVGTSKVLSTIG